MGKTRSRRRDNLITIASGDKALTLYHRCSYTLTLLHLVGFTFLCFLPLRKLPLALCAVIVFPYLRDEEPGKGFYNGLWKFNFMGRFIWLIFWQRCSPFPKRRTRPAGGRNKERVSCSSLWGRLSVHTENGADQFIFQTAFHVLVQAGVGTAAFIVDCPGAELVYVALIVPQDLLHGISVPGAGRIAHRQRQQLSAFVVTALHSANLLSSLSVLSAGHSAILFCAAGRHSGTGPKPPQSCVRQVQHQTQN